MPAHYCDERGTVWTATGQSWSLGEYTDALEETLGGEVDQEVLTEALKTGFIPMDQPTALVNATQRHDMSMVPATSAFTQAALPSSGSIDFMTGYSWPSNNDDKDYYGDDDEEDDSASRGTLLKRAKRLYNGLKSMGVSFLDKGESLCNMVSTHGLCKLIGAAYLVSNLGPLGGEIGDSTMKFAVAKVRDTVKSTYNNAMNDRSTTEMRKIESMVQGLAKTVDQLADTSAQRSGSERSKNTSGDGSSKDSNRSSSKDSAKSQLSPAPTPAPTPVPRSSSTPHKTGFYNRLIFGL